MTKPQYEPHPLISTTHCLELARDVAPVKVKLQGPGVVVAPIDDADDPEQMTGYVHRSVPRGRQAMLLDVTDIGFLAVQGLHALLVLGGQCVEAGGRWAFGTGRSIIRLMRLLKHADMLAAVASIAEALEEIDRVGQSPADLAACGARPALLVLVR